MATIRAASLPRGIVTFLFTDIEGSTRLLEALGNRYAAVLARHRHLIVDACVQNGGVPVNTEGDALFIAFAGAAEAAAAAIDAQQALAAESWPDGGRVLVRMGLHSGEPEVADDDYVGMAVHVAARVASAGHGGQVLITDVAHRLANEPQAVALGAHRLKDVGEHRLLQLIVEGGPTEFPPLRTLTALPNNLPAAVDAFVGRQLEQSELVAAIEAHRLVTLTGPGGSGKTRLAVETASTLLPAFADGVWLVSLATVAGGAGVLPEIAGTLRVAERVGESLGDALEAWLRERHLLLLLDNCEHVVDAVTRFCDRHLPSASGLRVLATSREFLGVRGEHAIRTPPLTISEDPSLAVASDAVELFLTRAEACAPRLGDVAADLDLVVQVCRRLDGLPLAIELAASRLRALSLQQLAARLDDRFRLLTGGSRSDLPRQRTLEAVVSWSYDLLNETERSLFARLGVFPHHFTLDMVEDICDGEPIDRDDIVDVLSRLVEKSLVTTVAVEGALRYQLLETLRHYALDRLVEHGEAERWRARLLDWSVVVAESIERVLRTPAMDRALRAATLDAPTHRAAMTWAAERGRAVEALRVASAIPVAAAADRLPLLQSYVASAADADDRALGFAFAAIGNLAFERSEWELSTSANGRAVTHFEGAGLHRHAAWAQYLQMHSTWGAGQLEIVDALVADAIDGFRRADDQMGLGYALWVASLRCRDLDEADRLASDADALLRTEDVPLGVAHNVEGRGIIALDRGEVGAGATFVAEAIELFSAYDNAGCTAHALEAAAVVLAMTGRDALAAELIGAAEELRRRSGQGHRPWEVRQRHGAIEERLALDDEERSRLTSLGRRHTLASAASLALDALRGVSAYGEGITAV